MVELVLLACLIKEPAALRDVPHSVRGRDADAAMRVAVADPGGAMGGRASGLGGQEGQLRDARGLMACGAHGLCPCWADSPSNRGRLSMATWRPDPSFYPSPRMAMQAPAEKLAYVAAFDPEPQQARRDRGGRRRSRLGHLRPDRRPGRRCPTPATSCITSAGTPAAPACARTRRTRMSSGATWSCRACARRASTSSTPSPTRRTPKIVKVIEPEEIAAQGRLQPAAHRPLRPRRHLCQRARRRRGQGAGRRLPARPRELRRARPLGDRPRPAGAGLRLLVASRPRHHGHQRMGHARHVRERRSCPRCCSAASTATTCISGTCTSASTCRRSTSAPSTSSCSSCARRTTRPRPTASSACVISLKDLSSSIWTWYRDGDRLGGQEDHRHPGRARRPRPAAAGCSSPSRPCRRWSPTSTCRWTTTSSTSPAGAPATCTQYDVSDPFAPEADRHGADRRHRRPRRAPGDPGRPLNGGPQMVEISRDGRRVYFTNSLYGVDRRAVLPRGPRRLDGQARRRPGRRHRLRRELLPRLAEGPPAASDPAGGRRLLVRLLLLPVTARLSPAA